MVPVLSWESNPEDTRSAGAGDQAITGKRQSVVCLLHRQRLIEIIPSDARIGREQNAINAGGGESAWCRHIGRQVIDVGAGKLFGEYSVQQLIDSAGAGTVEVRDDPRADAGPRRYPPS